MAASSDDRQPGWTVAYKAVSVEEPALVHQRLFRVFHLNSLGFFGSKNINSQIK